MDLFDYERKKFLEKEAPLSHRMRPTNLNEFVGQSHILNNSNTLLNRILNSNNLISIIFYGPPGTGKTTLAKIISKGHEFIKINATTSGIKDIKESIKKAKDNFAFKNNKTILFIDEIHRFNKLQQDTLLPYVENGTIILIGATTQNPFLEVNSAIISRVTIIELKPHTYSDIKNILNNAIKNEEKGLGKFNISIDEDALDYIVILCDGDARVALNILEITALSLKNNDKIIITKDTIKQYNFKKVSKYDKTGDNHYNIISAFIKSIRGSDPDAAVFYLAKMLQGGEDIKFIARRLIILASEDIGNADPYALTLATSTFDAVNFIGMPESRIILAQTTIYLACAKKSNSSYIAINRALSDAENITIKDIPNYLKSSGYNKLKEDEYLYPHDFKNNYVKQQYFPDELKNKIYYNPTENGYEKKIFDRLKNLRSDNV